MAPLNKYWSWLAIAAAVFGALNQAEVLALVGPAAAGIITVASTVVAAISRALTDKDGDGKPDWSL